MSANQNLYLPVEGLARELDGKLLLALVAKERGWAPLVGYKHVIRDLRAELPPGIFLYHNARLSKPALFRRMARYGHRTVVLDEEALVRQTDEIFLSKHDPDAFANVRLVLCWGEDDAELWRRSGRVDPARVAVVGNPRIDMLRRELRAFHQPEIDSIRGRFGEYVLVNTNFATVNHFVPGRSTVQLVDRHAGKDVIDQTSALLRHKEALFRRFLALVPKIAGAIAPLRLVVRPHPSERHEPWLAAAANAPNVTVIAEGSVVPWIAGARALIHNGCTSAVESAVIGTTILTYRPVRSEALDNPLPNGLGIECPDDDSLLRSLGGIIADGSRPLAPGQVATLEHHVASSSGSLSSERLVNAIDRLQDIDEGTAVGLSRIAREMPRQWLHWRAGYRRVRDSLTEAGRTRRAYIERKTSEMTPEYLNERIARFRAALGRFDGRQARQVADCLFAIE